MHVLEPGPGRYRDRRSEAVRIAIFVGNIFDKQHEQDVVLILAGIHPAAQLIAGGPKGGVEVGFFDGHVSLKGSIIFIL
jgi:prepilin-type processing-associated H-X9-DG protein